MKMQIVMVTRYILKSTIKFKTKYNETERFGLKSFVSLCFTVAKQSNFIFCCSFLYYLFCLITI